MKSSKTKNELDVNGMRLSYLLSVDNDTLWIPVVERSLERCFNEIDETNKFDCVDQIPMRIYDIIDCAYVENFLRCARWNPNRIKGCADTYEYAKKCLYEDE